MTDNQKTAVYAGLVALAAVLFKLRRSSTGGVLVNMDDGQTAPIGDQMKFALPYLQTNPGIPDMSQILNRGPVFNSAINLNINPSLGMQLSRSYIPLFGFVGVQTIGAPLQNVKPVSVA